MRLAPGAPCVRRGEGVKAPGLFGGARCRDWGWVPGLGSDRRADA